MATATKAKDKSKSRPKAVRRRRPPKFWSYEKDFDKFRGEYIAFEGDHIVAHGPDARVVLDAARKLVSRPILQLVPRGHML